MVHVVRPAKVGERRKQMTYSEIEIIFMGWYVKDSPKRTKFPQASGYLWSLKYINRNS